MTLIIKKLRYINQDCLKVIALLTMTIDHIGSILIPTCDFLRLIGRTSFPIFAFLIAFHLSKHNLFQKYLKRLFIFSILTTIILMPFIPIFPLNILWTFSLALIALYGIQYIQKRHKAETFLKYISTCFIIYIGGILSILTDYPLFGFFYILTLYNWLKTKRFLWCELSLILSFLMNINLGITAGVISLLTTFLLIIQKIPPKNAIRFLKPWWIFYAYYPAHLIILYVLALTK